MKTIILNQVKKIKAFDTKRLFTYPIFIGLSYILINISNSYSLNPFILPFVFLSLKFGVTSFIFSYLSLTLFSFLSSLSYGLEILIIVTSYVFLSLIPNRIFKNQQINILLPFIIINFALDLMYLINTPSLFSLIDISMMGIIGVALITTFDNFLNKLNNKYLPINYLALTITLASFPLIFKGNVSIASIATIVITLFFTQVEKRKECHMALILFELLVFKLFLKSIDQTIVVILFPLIFASLFSNYFVYIVFLITTLLTQFLTVDKFYQNSEFFEVLIGVAIVICIDILLKDKISNKFFSQNDAQKDKIVDENKKQNSLLNNLIDYLNLLKSKDHFEIYTPPERTSQYIEHELCERCPSMSGCIIKKNISSYLMEINETKRKEINKECLYPNKLLYKIRFAAPIFKNEEECYNKNEIVKRTYEDDIDALFSPIYLNLNNRCIENIEFISKLKSVGIDNSASLTIGENVIYNSYVRLDDEQIDRFVEEILENYQKKIVLDDIIYLMVDNMYSYKFNICNNYYLEYHVLSEPKNSLARGDDELIIKKDRYSYCLLFDGMGHDKEAGNISGFLKKYMYASLNMGDNYEQILLASNRLLQVKSLKEQYVALDFLVIDMLKLKGRLYKFGSYNSFIYRGNNFLTLDKIVTPIGILDSLVLEPIDIDLEENDIILLMSDGLNLDDKESVYQVIRYYHDLSIYELSHKIYEKLNKLDDDKTFVILKVKR